MKYLVTKKQVREMYEKVLDNYNRNIKGYDLHIYTDNNNRTQWHMGANHHGKLLLKIESADESLFEWVILKELGGRRQYTKRELVDGIQWNITKNYNKMIKEID